MLEEMEMMALSVEEDANLSIEIPRGGPIYIPNLVGPLIRVPDFESSVVQQLRNLDAELPSDSSQSCDDDISVDELKIFTEEELVDMALKEAFKNEENAEYSMQLSEERSNKGRQVDGRISRNKHACLESSGREENTSALFESSKGSHFETGCNGTVSKKNPRKRNRRKANSCAVENSYIGKVEEFAKTKQNQDEDKAAAKLHSLIASCKINESAISSSDRIGRMKSLRSTNSETKVKSSSIQEHIALLYPEIVLCVEVYHNTRKWVKTQEFLVLGRQPLTELRDKIYCLTDQVMQKARQHDPSGYFLIEDVFCNDLRDPSAIDYSLPIFDWLRNSKVDALRKWESIIIGTLQQKQKEIVGNVTTLHLPRFKAVDMHKTQFCDLTFQLGAGYLYCHQGDCKHTIVIRDMRLIHPEDVHNRAAYPMIIFQLKLRYQKCAICKIYRATKVTVDDKWAKERILAISVMTVISFFTTPKIILSSILTFYHMIISMINYSNVHLG